MRAALCLFTPKSSACNRFRVGLDHLHRDSVERRRTFEAILQVLLSIHGTLAVMKCPLKLPRKESLVLVRLQAIADRKKMHSNLCG